MAGFKRVCWPPSQIIGGGGAAPRPCSPLPTPMVTKPLFNRSNYSYLTPTFIEFNVKDHLVVMFGNDGTL